MDMAFLISSNFRKKDSCRRRGLGVLIATVLLSVGMALADAVPVQAVSMGGIQTRDQQLREIRDVLRGGRGGFIDLGFNYLPLPTQTPLNSQYGEHEGYAFKHHVDGFLSGETAKYLFLGALFWFERSGWDGEDFFVLPSYNTFSHVSSVTTWGLSATQTQLDMTFAAGMQHYNVERVGDIFPAESDSLLYSWAHLRWNFASLQANFNRTNVRFLRLSLDLESRLVYGGRSSGILTYLPNIEFTVYNESADRFSSDRYRLNWEQNLYRQILYAEARFDFPDDGFRYAALKFYPDASRMVAFEATCIRRNQALDGSDKLLWGGAIEFPFIRFGYNSAYEYDNLFHAKGTFIVEIQFNLGSVDGFLFARGGTRSAPLETSKVEKKNKELPDSGDGLIHLDKMDSSTGTKSKTIDAKGVRYEKVDGGK